jgi:hypothetical protein
MAAGKIILELQTHRPLKLNDLPEKIAVLVFWEGAQGFSPAEKRSNTRGFSPGSSLRKTQSSFFCIL